MASPQKVWTPLELIGISTGYLAERGVPSARLDAELLLAHVLRMSRLQLYLEHERPMVAEELSRYRELIRQRGQRIPLQLLIGSVQIHDLDFTVESGVFIPRPETEVLIDIAARLDFTAAGESGAPEQIVEVGVGSGCVGISLLARWPGSRVLGFDVNPAALDLSRRNAERHELSDRLELREGDAFGQDWPDCELVVSNPPYIASGERESLQAEVREHDPAAALFSGEDGLDAIRALVERAARSLRSGGWLAFEHGFDQAAAVAALLNGPDWVDVALHEDLAGLPRVTVARRSPRKA